MVDVLGVVLVMGVVVAVVVGLAVVIAEKCCTSFLAVNASV